MSRRQSKPEELDPAELVGHDADGNVRPADDRYLTDEQIEKRDAYVEKVSGPDAQQLVAKREGFEAEDDRG